MKWTRARALETNRCAHMHQVRANVTDAVAMATSYVTSWQLLKYIEMKLTRPICHMHWPSRPDGRARSMILDVPLIVSPSQHL